MNEMKMLTRAIMISLPIQAMPAIIACFLFPETIGYGHALAYLFGIVGGLCIYHWTPTWHQSGVLPAEQKGGK